jgi:hypothetical protein
VVREQDVEQWMQFFEQFGIPTAFERQPRERLDGSLQIVLEPRSELTSIEVEGYPVISRDETIDYMKEHSAQFQSALSMLDRMYDDVDIDVAYRDTEQARSNHSNEIN